MRKLLRFIRDFFGFSRTELNGFLVLIPIMIIALLAPAVYRRWITQDRYNDPLIIHRLDSIVARVTDTTKSNAGQQHEFFEFDPNLATVEELKELGFPPYLAQRIANYRTRGGRFRSSNDLLKIYGVDTLFIEKVKPYVRIAETTHSVMAAPAVGTGFVQSPPFDLNLADTTQLKEVFGIGSKLAFRIVRYRESLGGFVSMSQLNEVFGLDAVTVEELQRRSFIDQTFVPRKLNINQATAGELDKHPYISPQVARAIAAYRLQHGPYYQVSDITNVEIVNDSILQRLTPYLEASAPD